MMYKIKVPENVQQVMVTFGNANSQLFDMQSSLGEPSINDRFYGVSQIENFEKLHEKSDVFESVVGSSPIFSRKFYELTKDILSAELNFIPCEIDGVPDFFWQK